MSLGPAMVAVQLRRFSGEEGKAETPGVEESISWRSSVWRLEAVSTILEMILGNEGRLIVKKFVPFGDALGVLTAGCG